MAVIGLYVGLRLYGFLGATTQTAQDTLSYTEVARTLGPFDPSFYGAPRPFVIPLLYEIVGRGGWAWTQWLVATGAWMALALVVASGIARRSIQFAALATMLALSLAQPVAVWDRVLLSESLTISLGVLLLATVALALRRASRARVAWLAVVLFLWASVRDGNAPAGALLLVTLAVALLVARRRALAAAFVGVSIAALVFTQISANQGKRWEFSFMNVVGARVLPSAEVRTYFVDHGMPYDNSIRRLSGYYATTNDYALFHAPRLLNWVRADGRRVYATFLLTHPGYLTYWPAHDRELFAPIAWVTYQGGAFPMLPEPVEAAVYPSTPGRALFLVAIALGAAAAFLRYRRREWLLPFAVIAITPPHLTFVWHADAMETGRHAVFASVALRVAALWLLFLALDAATTAVRDQRVARRS